VTYYTQSFCSYLERAVVVSETRKV